MNATPEAELRDLRVAQVRDRKKLRRHWTREVARRITRRAGRIAHLATRVAVAARLRRHGALKPWLVLREADRAADAADVPIEEFRAMALTVLTKETGIPQRAVYGCDWGTGNRGRRPYCNDPVTKANATPFIRWVLADPYGGRMNGMHWTQTTWFEKLERVQAIGKPHKPKAHLRVCLGDLAILRASHGRRDAFRAYNGSGDAAEAYARDAEEIYPDALRVVQPKRRRKR